MTEECEHDICEASYQDHKKGGRGRLRFCIKCEVFFSGDNLDENDKQIVLEFARELKFKSEIKDITVDKAVHCGEEEEFETRVSERPRRAKKHNQPCKERTHNKGFQKRNQSFRRRM